MLSSGCLVGRVLGPAIGGGPGFFDFGFLGVLNGLREYGKEGEG